VTDADLPPSPDELTLLRAAIPPGIHFGTSSWNYPGWEGLVYRRKYPKTGASGKMLAEYAEWPLFSTVGIDSSFYNPLSEKTLDEYAAALPAGFRCVSKVWDRITVHTHSKMRDKAHAGEPNPDFLNPELFIRAVLEPCLSRFGGHVGPFVFEFQAITRGSRVAPQEFADQLDRFFSALPRTAPYAVEVRNEEYLTPAYFAVLREHSVAHCFNSWTRMPSIGGQLALPGAIGAPFIVARALLRPGRYYAEAVDAFAPYDRIQDRNPELRADLVRLVETALKARIPAYILVNNRAEGSAPLTIAAVARLLADRGEAKTKAAHS
jgi:uncharacterized protein YecE (DUF72 family)